MGKKNKGGVVEAIKCDICCIVLNSDQQAQQHFSGKTHMKKEKARKEGGETMASPLTNPLVAAKVSTPDFVPEIIKVDQPPNPFAVLPKDAPEDPTKKLDPVAQAVFDNMRGKLPTKRKVIEIPCAVCAIVFNSEDQADVHFKSQKHAKKLQTIELLNKQKMVSDTSSNGEATTNGGKTEDGMVKMPGNQFRCSFCNVSLNSVHQLEMHRAGQKHKNKLKLAQQQQNGGPPAKRKPPSKFGSNNFNRPMNSNPSFNSGPYNGNGNQGENQGEYSHPEDQYYKQGPPTHPAWLPSGNQFQCRVCSIFFPGPNQLYQHISSPEHAEKQALLMNAPQS
ncbi:zinc finger protein 385B [Lingula anatina]|uniref:Zinc finger protein 385B n=1 Tax=Lingula anatina TaxID=7574 RepID=A0A1S3KE46_LINAN|nr:zinc finger protein 385B [Lingula anatina]|eukprot:XP_013420898.1 zinc finger protein 385B [Lingula anatina]